MRKTLMFIALLFLSVISLGQKLEKLTVEKIMRDPKWIGTSPDTLYWSHDGKFLLFSWNPEKATSDSVYYITTTDHNPKKTSYSFRNSILRENNLQYNNNKSSFVYAQSGDIYFTDVKSGKPERITRTSDQELNPQFSFNDSRIVYQYNSNLFSWDIASGAITQLTNFRAGGATVIPVTGSGNFVQRGNQSQSSGRVIAGSQDGFLTWDALENSDVLKSRKKKREERDAITKSHPREKTLRVISIDDRSVFSQNISPDGRYVTYQLFRPAAGNKSTIVPSFITESGYTEDLGTRAKVGIAQGRSELFVFDTILDTVLPVRTDSIPGLRDLPDYVKDYPKQLEQRSKNPSERGISFSGPSWSPKGNFAVVDIRSQDNKDRWLMLLNPSNGKLSLLDRQRDEAWVGGPGVVGFGGQNTGWLDENNFWFRSEATGYSHLYVVNVQTGVKKALTSGNYEVQQAQVSKDKKYFYITTNEVHPGEQHFYRLPVTGGSPEKITTMTGANKVTISPDEKYIGIVYSYSNRPWELYLQENKPGGKIQQITTQAQTEEFKSYAWKDPEVISFAARDGAKVYGRLFKPANPHPSKPAVIFVHGAGYLQNAHKWWSSYFREYMFHNLLADEGYYVLDIDYRGSAGYGRDWRTGIYRFMGGKDLTDHIDAKDYLVKNFGVNPSGVGIYGGSYGGFITLMAMFTEPDAFAAGAALRPVTDWAHYNHGYTSNILNEPFTDSIAYVKSSPIFFAKGLKGHLLICHGMVDVNVHYQDAVRLAQRLIELGKDNWELASYPVEDHGFVEPSSWTDEYKRIYKLFERVLKK